MMFREKYKQAYDKLRPYDKDLEYIIHKSNKRKKEKKMQQVLRPLVLTMLAVLVLTGAALPVLAKHVPAVYRIIEAYSPTVADFFVPANEVCESEGIQMQVEAINVDGQNADVIISFFDTTQEDRINGEMDLYDSYGLYSHAGVSSIGGCCFLEYDDTEKKAYFKVDLGADTDFDTEKLTFYVGMLLQGMAEERVDVDLTQVNRTPDYKEVHLSGKGGEFDSQYLHKPTESQPLDPRPTCSVLENKEIQEYAADEITLTQAAYADGFLKVQYCCGDLTRADRHVSSFITQNEGAQQYETCSISWGTMQGETPLTFEEKWFRISEEALETCEVYSIYSSTGECIDGDWKVTFRVN